MDRDGAARQAQRFSGSAVQERAGGARDWGRMVTAVEPASDGSGAARLLATLGRLRRGGAAGRNGAATKCRRAESRAWRRTDAAFEHEPKCGGACTASVSAPAHAMLAVPDSASCKAATMTETKRNNRVRRVIKGNVTAAAQ